MKSLVQAGFVLVVAGAMTVVLAMRTRQMESPPQPGDFYRPVRARLATPPVAPSRAGEQSFATSAEAESCAAGVAGSELMLDRDLLESQRALNDGTADQIDRVMTKLLPALVARSGPAAAQLAESITDPGLRADVMQMVARLWAHTDAAAAMGWAGKLAMEYERDAAVACVTEQVAAVDPERAVRLQAQWTSDGAASPSLQSAMQQWAEKNLSAASHWALAELHGDARNAAVARLAYVEAVRAPYDAADLAVSELPAGPVQDEAVVSVLHQWALRDFSEAAAWVRQFPEGALRDRALAELRGIAHYRGAERR